MAPNPLPPPPAGTRRALVPEIAGLTRPTPGPVRRLAGETMGTRWSLAWLGPADGIEAARTAVAMELDRIVAQMSAWEPDSDLSRFNRAPPGSWHALPADFADVMGAALSLAEATGGAFDPTLGELTDLWGFGPGARADDPAADAVSGAQERSGWRRLRRDGARLWQPGGLALDLNGIAKGYAVDRLALALTRLGITSFLVEIGGELRGRGTKPDLSPWWVGIETPPSPVGPPLPDTVVALHDLAIATSGDYRRTAIRHGRQVSHTLDPRTGVPLPLGIASVTVLHRSCMWADGHATALAVLGVEAGLAFATERGIAAHVVLRSPDGLVEYGSPRLIALMAADEPSQAIA